MAGRLLTGLWAFATIAVGDDKVHTFECDTPAGHFSSWESSTRATAILITGTLAVREMREDKKWHPVATVFIHGGANGKTTYGLRAYDADKTGKGLTLELFKIGGRESFGGVIKPGRKAVPFRLELTSTGTMRAKVGEAEHSVELGAFAPQSIELGCSTGDFSFGEVRIVETPPAGQT